MMMEVDIFDVAKYILRKNGPISTMKLQKLCYYAQSWSLAWDGANGPVCPELFHKHRGLYSVDEELFKMRISANSMMSKRKLLILF